VAFRHGLPVGGAERPSLLRPRQRTDLSVRRLGPDALDPGARLAARLGRPARRRRAGGLSGARVSAPPGRRRAALGKSFSPSISSGKRLGGRPAARLSPPRFPPPLP